ncbi:MAG: glycoside hydrolase family 2 TIM barrel-domain containing protein [Bacteroidales bacterium]
MKAFNEVTRFGIRKVEDYFNSHGYRGYKLNGKEILIKGGGWVDGMFLNDTEDKIRAQMEYVRHTHMNTIRLEGFWGNSEKFYDLADELGILLMAGWSCQWEWNGYLDKPEDEFMSIRTPEDIKLILDYTRDHISWLRNHPSIFVWVLGSDKLPRPELEAKYHQLFSKIDTSRPLLFSCKDQVSSISGKTGVKMRGPYDYVSPNYWYIDSINGGAFGFNTETGPGPQVPSLEVVKSMIPEDKLWPLNKMWNFHCGRNEFQTLDRYLTAFNKRYGKQANAEDFTFKSQASNLESMRAMYEAFAVNREKTTGIIQWMYNSAWPKLIWQFWDYNLLPNGAFYGARIGARQLNIVYNYGDNSVYVTNQTHEEKQKLEAKLEIYSINGTRLFDKTFSTSVLPDASNLVSILPTGIDYTRVFFLKLYLKDANQQLLADNIYWLSTKKDTPDFNKTEWFYTPLSDYADLTGLNYLQEAKIELQDTLTVKGDDCEMQVRIKNTGKPVAFLIELSIVGENSGKSVVPVLWDDNYISLVPGEEKSVKATFSRSSLKGDKPVLRYKGWNL